MTYTRWSRAENNGFMVHSMYAGAPPGEKMVFPRRKVVYDGKTSW